VRLPAFTLLLLMACGAPPMTATGFIALERDFQGYDTWESVTFDGPDIPNVHTAGPRKVFLNARAPAGSTEWPVGTVIVKELSFTTFAMAKRGGTYNANGAAGWEWFELTRDSNGTVRIKWRGQGPPLGESYSAAGQTCNDCHKGTNDSVKTPAFTLPTP
jgi:hypothetical protein